mgnify:CR=1 FL=1|jgi:hypothetical protein|tara:strand:- start:5347 stop:5529 length:183 start_codon:yes stop_codon:yes gene_type:complete
MSKVKSLKKIQDDFDYYHRKVEQMESEREEDRSWETKLLINRHKKLKLKAKEELAKLSNN